MLDETAKAFPQFPLVDNPVGIPCLPGYICEKHGVNPKVFPPCFVDTDGDNYLTIPPVRRRDCIAQFLLGTVDEPYLGFKVRGPIEENWSTNKARYSRVEMVV